MRAALDSLLHLQDPPRRTALAFGTGVFIAFSPFLGIHTPIAIVVAFACRLNRVAVLTGAWINFWALVPCYAFGTFIGRRILGVHSRRLAANFWDQAEALVRSAVSSSLVGDWTLALASMRAVLKGFGPLFWPFIVGNMLLAVLTGMLAYVTALRFLEARAHRLELTGVAARDAGSSTGTNPPELVEVEKKAEEPKTPDTGGDSR